MKTRFTKLDTDLSLRERDTLNSTETGAETGCDSLNSTITVGVEEFSESRLRPSSRDTVEESRGKAGFGSNHFCLGTGERKSILTRRPMRCREFSKAHLHSLSEAVYSIVGRDSSKFTNREYKIKKKSLLKGVLDKL